VSHRCATRARRPCYTESRHGHVHQNRTRVDASGWAGCLCPAWLVLVPIQGQKSTKSPRPPTQRGVVCRMSMIFAKVIIVARTAMSDSGTGCKLLSRIEVGQRKGGLGGKGRFPSTCLIVEQNGSGPAGWVHTQCMLTVRTVLVHYLRYVVCWRKRKSATDDEIFWKHATKWVRVRVHALVLV